MAVREDTGGTSVLGTAGLKFLLQSLILRERELDCVLETAPVISGEEKNKREEASRETKRCRHRYPSRVITRRH